MKKSRMMKIDVDKIWAWRNKNGVTKYSLAVKAGLSGYVLYRILKTGKVSKKHIEQLAMAMGTTVKSLEVK